MWMDLPGRRRDSRDRSNERSMHSLCDNLNHGARDDRVGCRCVRRKIKTLSYIHEIKGRLDVRKHPRDTMRQFGPTSRACPVLHAPPRPPRPSRGTHGAAAPRHDLRSRRTIQHPRAARSNESNKHFDVPTGAPSAPSGLAQPYPRHARFHGTTFANRQSKDRSKPP